MFEEKLDSSDDLFVICVLLILVSQELEVVFYG